MSRPRHLLEAAVFGALLVFGRVAPLPVLRALGTLAGELGYRLDRRHRQIALDNLEAALGGELGPAERAAVARACWRHFGRITFETLAFPRISRNTIGSLVRYEGLEHLESAYARGRGVLLFSGHYGHWELAALLQGHLGFRLSLVVRPLDNPFLDAMLARLRRFSGNAIISKRRAIRPMLEALERGEGVAIVIDQDARERGVFVPFFGRPASTTPTLALLALRTGAAIVPVFSLPEPRGRWRIVYEPEVPVRPSGNLRADVRSVTARCTAVIESWVRRRPELWLWMHRRWKTAPRGAGSEP
jgi:KDO2-lipid IV(A) lauroyltransferase